MSRLRKVVGIHSCFEALKVRKASEIKKVYFSPDWEESKSLLKMADFAREKGFKPEVLALKKLDGLAQNHQGVCVHVEGAPEFHFSDLPEQAVVLILDQIEDPKNLGAIIRTAWLMGVKGIFVSSRYSVGLSPAVMKTASGGVEHVPIQIGKLSEYFDILKENGFWIYGLGAENRESLWSQKLEGRLAFVMGGEHAGIRQSLKKACDKLLFIPQKEKSASYNVSVATGILLGECFRQFDSH